MAGFQLTLYGRIWVTPKGVVARVAALRFFFVRTLKRRESGKSYRIRNPIGGCRRC
jgi:hypothetical protein